MTMVSTCIYSYVLNRTPLDVDYDKLYEWFSKKSEIFKHLNSETLMTILDNATLVSVVSNEVVVRQGDRGDCFYVILNGTASIYINTDMELAQIESSSVTMEKESSSTSKYSTTRNLKQSDQKRTIFRDYERKELGELIGRYEDGGCFGELALIQKEHLRNATIIADEKLDLLCINGEMFNGVLRTGAESIYQEKMQFVNSSYLFYNWIPKYKSQIAMSLRQRKFFYDEDVMKQGGKCDGFIFLIKGTFKVFVDIRKHQTNVLTVFNDLMQSDSITSEVTKGPETPRIDLRNISATDRSNESSKQFLSNDVEIAIIGENDMIGDIEYGLGLSHNIFAAVTCEPCDAYILTKVHIDRILNSRKNAKSFEWIKKIGLSKLSLYYQRCSLFYHFPFLHRLIQEVNKQNVENTIHRSPNAENMRNLIPIFKPGPLIDFYGPGSVFYRNRLKREKMKKRHVERDETISNMPPNRGVVTAFPENIQKELSGISTITRGKTVHIETVSDHVLDLEERINRFMVTIKMPYSSGRKEFTIFKLPRINNQGVRKSARLESKNRDENETNKETNDNNGTEIKKAENKPRRNYTEKEFRKLKREVYLKEKKLEVFRLKSNIQF